MGEPFEGRVPGKECEPDAKRLVRATTGVSTTKSMRLAITFASTNMNGASQTVREYQLTSASQNAGEFQ